MSIVESGPKVDNSQEALIRQAAFNSASIALDVMFNRYQTAEGLLSGDQTVTAFIPGNLAQKFIDEHDEVMIERIGGKQGRSKGDIPGVRFKVIKVNDQPLDRLWMGKIEKGRR